LERLFSLKSVYLSLKKNSEKLLPALAKVESVKIRKSRKVAQQASVENDFNIDVTLEEINKSLKQLDRRSAKMDRDLMRQYRETFTSDLSADQALLRP